MKKFISLLLVAGLSFAAIAQNASEAVSAAIDAERKVVTAERLRLEEAFSAEEVLCYKKFFVNNCLNEIKPRKREVMAGLKSREVALDEQERRLKAADQIRKTEEKSSPEVLQQEAERRSKAMEDLKAREERARNKTGERTTLEQSEASKAADTADKLRSAREMERARADKQAASAEELKKFNDKQQEARERKASRDKKQREQTKPAAAPLPTPN